MLPVGCQGCSYFRGFWQVQATTNWRWIACLRKRGGWVEFQSLQYRGTPLQATIAFGRCSIIGETWAQGLASQDDMHEYGRGEILKPIGAYRPPISQDPQNVLWFYMVLVRLTTVLYKFI